MNIPVFKLIKRILLQVRAYWPHLISLFFLNLIAAPIALLKPFALKILIDSGFGSQPVPNFIAFFFVQIMNLALVLLLLYLPLW